jgi:hypothetical protein
MTNIEKVKRILDAGHFVKASTNKGWDGYYNIYDIVEENAITYSSGWVLMLLPLHTLENYIFEPVAKNPNYKVGEKVKVLDIAREIEEYNLLDSDQQEMIWWIYTIESIDCYWIRLKCDPDSRYDDSYTFPSWCLSPAFDDEKDTDLILSWKEVTVTIDGKEYTAVMK